MSQAGGLHARLDRMVAVDAAIQLFHEHELLAGPLL